MMERSMEKAMFGAGCFWCIEDDFRRTKGVVDAAVGYAGGDFENPTYRDVCTGQTAHAEVVFVEFDPQQISYPELLDVFWSIHDPTQMNRQGPDVGSQYRSAIFYFSDEQKEQAEASKKQLEVSKRFSDPIATEIVPAAPFYRAEEYHQQYNEKMRSRQ